MCNHDKIIFIIDQTLLAHLTQSCNNNNNTVLNTIPIITEYTTTEQDNYLAE